MLELGEGVWRERERGGGVGGGNGGKDGEKKEEK
jgi:hypothetical protein